MIKNLLASLFKGPDPFKNKPRFAGYYLVESLGRGSFGDIQKAIKIDEVEVGRYVALKRLQESHSEQHKQRFQREIDILFQISHPNVVKVLEYGEEENVCFFTMEVLEGEDLELYLRKETPDTKETVSIVKQVASGLQVAHDGGVVHRDIKPGNIFVCTDGRVKVIDFGLAKDPQDTVKITLQGEGAAGSIPYMPPDVEPVFSGQEFELTPAYDQFALATICYEMLTGGRRPFFCPLPKKNGPDFSSIFFSKLHSVGDLPAAEQLDEVLHKAMDPDPKKRFGSVLEFAQALERAVFND